MRRHSFALLTLGCVVQLGCATILGPKDAAIAVNSIPSGAQVFIDGVDRGPTPTKLQLDIRKSYTIVLKKDGEPDQSYYLRNYVGAGWVVLDILLLLVPLIVDAGTQEWNYFAQDSVTVCFPSQVAEERAAADARAAEMGAITAKIPACNMSGSEAWKTASPEQKSQWFEECRKRLSETAPMATPCLAASAQGSF
jgi:PEGA domain